MPKLTSHSRYIRFAHKPKDGLTPVFDSGTGSWKYELDPPSDTLVCSADRLGYISDMAAQSMTKAEDAASKAEDAGSKADTALMKIDYALSKADTAYSAAASAYASASEAASKAVEAREAADSKVSAEEAVSLARSDIFEIVPYDPASPYAHMPRIFRFVEYMPGYWHLDVRTKGFENQLNSAVSGSLGYADLDAIQDLQLRVFEIEKKLGLA